MALSILHPVLGLLATDGTVALLSFNLMIPPLLGGRPWPRTRAAMTSAKLLVDAFGRIREIVTRSLTAATRPPLDRGDHPRAALSAVLMS